MRVRFGAFVLDRAARQLLKEGAASATGAEGLRAAGSPDPPAARRGVQGRDPGRGLARRPSSRSRLLSSLVSSGCGGALGGTREGPRFVRTVHGFGYAFDCGGHQGGCRPRRRPIAGYIEWEGRVLHLGRRRERDRPRRGRSGAHRRRRGYPGTTPASRPRGALHARGPEQQERDVTCGRSVSPPGAPWRTATPFAWARPSSSFAASEPPRRAPKAERAASGSSRSSSGRCCRPSASNRGWSCRPWIR